MKSSKIPYFFVIFFSVFIIVDLIYIYLANKTWRGVSSGDAYQKGLNYNQILELQNRQQQLGWKITTNFENRGDKNGILKVKIVDKDSNYFDLAKVVVKLRRPTQEGFDFEQNLIYQGDGWYKSYIDFPLKGQWQFEIVVSHKQDSLQTVKKYVIQ